MFPMAVTEHKPVKQLHEMLQEQQEPFVLEVYLVERGYLRNGLDSDGSFINSRHNNSRKSQKKEKKKSEKGIPRCSKLIRAIYNRVISLNEKIRTKSSSHKDGICSLKRRNDQEITEIDRFSSARSTTVFNSSSRSDVDDHITANSQGKDYNSFPRNMSKALKLSNPQQDEAGTDGRHRWQCIEEFKQLSPVSVLEELPSHGGSPLHHDNTTEENPPRLRDILLKEVTEDAILSASLWKVLFHPTTQEPFAAGVSETKETSLCMKSKVVLQQTKKVLFDFVKEAVETRARKEKKRQQLQQQCHKQCRRPEEELRKVIAEKIRSWEKQFGDESNLTELVHLDLRDTEQEWSDFEAQRKKIGCEIGDAIFEELRNEIVMYMTGLLPTVIRL